MKDFNRVVWMLTAGDKSKGINSIALYSTEDNARNELNKAATTLNAALNLILEGGDPNIWQYAAIEEKLRFHKVTINRWESPTRYLALQAIGVEE